MFSCFLCEWRRTFRLSRSSAVVARSGPRVRLHAALGRSARRMFLVGRVTAEPGGALLDVIAVKVDVQVRLGPDPGELLLDLLDAPGARLPAQDRLVRASRVRGRHQTSRADHR